MHLLAYDGAHGNLFRAAFMQSGSPLPVDDITDGQHYFDTLVSQTNCTTASDKLACLREVPYADLTAAINASPSAYSYQVSQVSRILKLSSNLYQSLIFPWLPRVDGNFLTKNPQQLVAEGKIANVPLINGMLAFSFVRRKLKIIQVTVMMRAHYSLFQLRISRM